MSAGKLLSLVLLVVMTIASVAALVAAIWIDPIRGMAPVPRVLVLSGLLAAAFACGLLPLGFALDRSLAKLRRYIETAAESGSAEAYCGPRWLHPITHAFTGALDAFRQREQNLLNQLRELEIRHRVSEAERKQVEAVIHSLRDAVIVTDAFNEIVMVNEMAAELLGFNIEDVIHKPIGQVIADEHLCQLISDAREHANFRERRHVEHELEVRAEGDDEPSPRVFDVILSCVENHKNEVSGVVAVLHDLTRDRELSQMKSDFVSKASHELRTPLSSIRAYVEMLVDGEAEDEDSRQEFYRIIYNETDRLGRLIDNMLNISRIEAGIVQIERAEVDMKSVITRATDTLEPQAREKDITIHRKLAGIDLCVEGDEDMLYQVTLNLLSNAIKYTPEGGRITVSADSDNLTRSVLVSVSDTGLGIPPDSIPKLFEKFYRVENYKRVAKGTGLGLSLCKHIVETLHHGQIGVESKLGMGSRFWFTTPMHYAGMRAA